jgi:hypothetical protein
MSDGSGTNRGDGGERGDDRAGTRSVEVDDGDAVVPDAGSAPDKDDLKPEDPPVDGPAEGDPDKTSAVPPPVPAHGEMASAEQLEEAARAAREDEEKA